MLDYRCVCLDWGSQLLTLYSFAMVIRFSVFTVGLRLFMVAAAAVVVVF